MCTYIYTFHEECRHKRYQNTFKCLSARGSTLFGSSRGFTLDRTMNLPDQTPREIPNPMCDGKMKRAIRPVAGRCRACACQEKARKEYLGEKVDVKSQQELEAEMEAAAAAAANRSRDDSMMAAGVRSSILGLEMLMASGKPEEKEED